MCVIFFYASLFTIHNDKIVLKKQLNNTAFLYWKGYGKIKEDVSSNHPTIKLAYLLSENIHL